MKVWNISTGTSGEGSGAVTIVEGTSFAISAGDGSMLPDHPHGVFYDDIRIVSKWEFSVDNQALEPLTVIVHDQPYQAVFLARARRGGRTSNTIFVERERRVGTGMREDITLRNMGREPAACTVTLVVDADFADLFEVKKGEPQNDGHYVFRSEGTRIIVERWWRGMQRGVIIQADDATSVAHDRITFRAVVPERGQWSTTVLVRPVVDGEDLRPRFPKEQPVDESEPARRLREWQSNTPVVSTDNDALLAVLRRSQQDVGALRIFDSRHPQRSIVAAGAPWFMALFGRDSLLTAYMALPLDPSLALGTLQTLADRQGVEENILTEEEPGRILHESRLGKESGLWLGDGTVYYGTADATPLFVILLGELSRWGADPAEIEKLLPHADRALEWIERYGDRDGDGFVEYRRRTDQGLVNQGWKDSWDGINFADGRIAEAPIALCEVQGYVYAAYLARAYLAHQTGDDQRARYWTERAADLKKAFNERFWQPELGYYAVALDHEKKPVDACTSNMGHCLWSGIVDEDKAPYVADRLLSPTMFSGWGIRTLATDMGAYDPVSYHNGSVWPHDNAIIASGLMRYGFTEHAQRVATALFEAAEHFGYRLPELFCGFDRTDYPKPVPYPTSCSPQAWAATTPIHLLRTLLRFDPWVPRGELRLAPSLPPGYTRLRIERLPIAGSQLTVDVTGDEVSVEGLPEGLRLVSEPRELDSLSLVE